MYGRFYRTSVLNVNDRYDFEFQSISLCHARKHREPTHGRANGICLGNIKLEWLARTIVTESCYHVEGSLKRQLDVKGNLSIGRILGRANARSLGDDLLSALQYLNKFVYNAAKHLECRVLGARILRDSGITTKHGKPCLATLVRWFPRHDGASCMSCSTL